MASSSFSPAIGEQGTVGVGTVLFTCVHANTYVNRIMFSNTSGSAFDITVSKYNSALGTTTQLYSFNLDAGDVLEDTGSYILNLGDRIEATTAIANTVFILEGIQNDTNI